MDKKRVLMIGFFALILLIGIVSAGWFSDFFSAKITGKSVYSFSSEERTGWNRATSTSDTCNSNRTALYICPSTFTSGSSPSCRDVRFNPTRMNPNTFSSGDYEYSWVVCNYASSSSGGSGTLNDQTPSGNTNTPPTNAGQGMESSLEESAVSLINGLVLYYNFDEFLTEGRTSSHTNNILNSAGLVSQYVKDWSNSNNYGWCGLNAQYCPSSDQTIFKFGEGSFYFPSNSIKYIFNNKANFQNYNNSGAISLWFYPLQGAGNYNYVLIDTRTTSGSQGFLIQRRGSDQSLGFGWNGVSGSANYDYIPGLDWNELKENWNHVLMTWDSTKGKKIIHINGEKVVETVASNLPTIVHSEVLIGDIRSVPTAGGYRFKGNIDEVAIWNRMLSSEEILSIYNSNKPLIQNPGIGSLDQGLTNTNILFNANEKQNSGGAREVSQHDYRLVCGDSCFFERLGRTIEMSENQVVIGSKNNAYNGYIMYSEQDVFTRFNNQGLNASKNIASENFIAVRYDLDAKKWYFDNGQLISNEFEPRPYSDLLIASIEHKGGSSLPSIITPLYLAGVEISSVCYDDDSYGGDLGIQSYVKGVVTLEDGTSETDRCSTRPGYSTYVQEFFCAGDIIDSSLINCDNGCNNGACICESNLDCPVEYSCNEGQCQKTELCDFWDIDGNGEIEAITDGMLILNYLQGKTGQDLIGGGLLLSENSQRTSATEIEDYIVSIEREYCLFDVDGNGSIDENTDGQIIYKYLEGVIDENLLDFIGSNAYRTELKQILDFVSECSSQCGFERECSLDVDCEGDGKLCAVNGRCVNMNLLDKMALYLNFDNASNIYVDLSGKNNFVFCKEENCPEFNESLGKYKGTLNFNGETVFDIANSNKINFIEDVSFSFWLNKSSNPVPKEKLIFDKGSWKIFIAEGSSDLCFQIDDESVCFEDSVEDNEWKHYFLSYSKGNLSFYSQGILILEEVMETESMSQNNFNLSIGKNISGFLDEIIIWNRTLSSKEVRNVFQRGANLISSSIPDEGEVCSVVGIRKLNDNGKMLYCDPKTMEYKIAFDLDESCENDFQCIENVCLGGKCVSYSGEMEKQVVLLRKIWCFLTNPGSYFSSNEESSYNLCLAGEEE